ncbi:hypothetical protein DPEC_G00143510 [Dallia pectoralis]|uniref:Uncharacterized protein n=1 Tax=Dallia pectoralis TaxID=75939 RepID=A0ACC2GNW9_DALPE|nr:hypothetical protein DPEC_G00143510 [Dallia pectoralis]
MMIVYVILKALARRSRPRGGCGLSCSLDRNRKFRHLLVPFQPQRAAILGPNVAVRRDGQETENSVNKRS